MQRMQFYKSKFNGLVVAMAVAVISAPAFAWPGSGGDVSAGKTKSATCTACHGQNGISVNDNWPNLAGQKENYIVEQLHAFKSGTRTNPIMSGIAKMLNDQDIRDLAAYFSSLKP